MARRPTPDLRHADWRSSRAGAARAPGQAWVDATLTKLRRGREAVVEIDGQLDEALEVVRRPGKQFARDLADRMATSARRAGELLTGLGPAGSELF